MGAMLGVAMPTAEEPLEYSSSESEAEWGSDEPSSYEHGGDNHGSENHGSDTESECERGPAGADADSKASEKQSAKASGSAVETLSQVGASTKKEEAQPVQEERDGQCNLDDEEDLEVWEEPRILDCRLTDEQKAKFKKHLDLIFSLEVDMGRRIVFDPEDILEVMEAVQDYLYSEPMLIEDVPFDVVVVGDLHGQLYDLARIFTNFAKDGKPGWECRKYLFLGDYVDRGRQSLEIVMALFIIKMFHPNTIWLLRGNHEFLSVNAVNGFKEDIYMRYSLEETANYLFLQINATFCFLSVSAIVGDTWFCAHGGISGANFSRRTLRGIYKPYCRVGQDAIVSDLVWSDPAMGLQGSCYNAARDVSMNFGLNVLVPALNAIGCKGMIRGHSVLKMGHESNWNVLHSIFSATNCTFLGNQGAVAVVDEKGRVTFVEFTVKPQRTAWELALREKTGELTDEQRDNAAATAKKEKAGGV